MATPNDIHAESGVEANDDDAQFLTDIAGHMDGAITLARAHLDNGQHPQVTNLAGEVMTAAAGHVVAAMGLSRAIAGASKPAGATGYGGKAAGGKGKAAVSTAPAAAAATGGSNSRDPGGEARAAMLASVERYQLDFDNVLFRSMPFEVSSRGDGLTLEGYAAVFDSTTRINSWEGEFDETISRGAFARSLQGRSPVLMFEHGRHPLIGSMPLGVITRAAEDTKGLHIEARLSDNWLIQPVRDAVRDGAVTGMSFRFSVPEGGDHVLQRSGDVPLRTINQADVSELGPVVFPAYEPTTATVRSLLERFDFTGRPVTRSSGGGEKSADPAVIEALTYQQLLDEGALRVRKVF